MGINEQGICSTIETTRFSNKVSKARISSAVQKEGFFMESPNLANDLAKVVACVRTD